MERRKQPYSIQKRPTKRKNGFMFYVKFRDPETDEYLNAISSGCTNEADALRWAEKRVNSGLVGSTNPRFKDYVEGFWDRGSRYAQGRIAREKSISNGTCEIAEGNITPRDKYLGRAVEIQRRRRTIKQRTLNQRRKANRNQQKRAGRTDVVPVS